MTDLRLGLLIWSHATTWTAMRETALLAEHAGYDHVWTSDHLYATVGDPQQPILEGWTVLAAWAALLTRARLGLLVSANTFRHPALLAKMAVTVDQISGGRAILGLGAGWFPLEHEAHGLDFGRSTGERLAWLDESAPILRSLMEGDVVSHSGRAYKLREVRHAPRSCQERLPLLIGGGGERKTLRTVAQWADMWNVFGTPDEVAKKDGILREHCAELGRPTEEIERTVTIKLLIRDDPSEARRAWGAQCRANGMGLADHPNVLLGPPDEIAITLRAYRDRGFGTVIADAPAPYDRETIERLTGEVLPLVHGSIR